ncbi:hypothetical protein Nekkels1_89 [Cellulophaga phage Nekkels_1]|uniref:DUF1376 domain-containing protein n=1 Tax=Cellulophaga phage Nekkels_1 TaxID=2745692 RepID=A0A8E4XZN1_9CAUD|nr:hypothetical protein M1M31_gp89 [Cellulophaga phage Nekkels_1]QQO97095.1 hypothetical protein Nekkels1_89 [Cellulophaga phage Nekkels_1]QQO97190.1 hypothetical protein Nekkels2_90 [Cellulophaga phage Nekkels_2]
MAKDLPYFKFFCSEWNDGDITLEDYDVQGVFINICSYYWSKECDATKKLIYKRFKNEKDIVDYIVEEGFIKFNNEHLSIKFLDEQFTDLESSSKSKSLAGKKSAKIKKLRKEIDELCVSFSTEFNENLTNLQQEFNTNSTDLDFLNQHISTIKIRRDNKRKEEKRKDEMKEGLVEVSEINDNNFLNQDSIYPISRLKENYLSNEQVLNAVLNIKENKFRDLEHLKSRLDEYISHVLSGGQTSNTPKDFAKYFRNWNKKSLEINENKETKKAIKRQITF